MSQYFLRLTEQTSINTYSSQHMTKQVQVLYTHTHIYSNFTNLLQDKLDLTYKLQCKDPMLQQQSHIWLALLLNQAGVLFVSA
jgi:hypothetical protein